MRALYIVYVYVVCGPEPGRPGASDSDIQSDVQSLRREIYPVLGSIQSGVKRELVRWTARRVHDYDGGVVFLDALFILLLAEACENNTNSRTDH